MEILCTLWSLDVLFSVRAIALEHVPAENSTRVEKTHKTFLREIKSFILTKTKQKNNNKLLLCLMTTNARLRQVLHYLSHDMGFPSMWYVRPAKAQTSLRVRAV